MPLVKPLNQAQVLNGGHNDTVILISKCLHNVILYQVFNSTSTSILSGGISLGFSSSEKQPLLPVNMGLWNIRTILCNPEYGDKVARVNRKTLLISLVCGLPCIAAELYLYYGYQREVAFAHLGSALIPVAVKLLMGNNSAHNSVDWVTAGNLLSIFVVTFLESNYYGFAMTACYTVNYFLITTSSDLGGLGDYSTPVVSVTSRDMDLAWYKPGMTRAVWYKPGMTRVVCGTGWAL
uniref:Uncharacterized protein n=1 Tax=Timema douglasi TaxID=61478 RepID=A0A7R8VJM9_TIMDO|nr:unnamed protein product [Timema douglasi]